MKLHLIPLIAAALLCMAQPAQAKIVTKEIAYKDGDTALTGYFAYDDATEGKLPGVLVVHEWWGHNDYARKRAEQLAGLGYAAFALDMYGTGVKGDTPDAAGALAKPFYDDRSLMRSRAGAGLAVLTAQENVDASRIAVVGYCFGGTVALEMARGGADVDGVVSFHGGLGTPARAAKGDIRGEILALNGAADPMVPEAERKAFAEEMTAAHVSFKSVDYPGATHAFTNPAADVVARLYGIPVGYDKEADEKSWEEMKAFLTRVLAVKP